jgi:hypothetical protein
MHGSLVALDPSVRSVGVALFAGGVLVDAATIKCPSCGSKGRVAECPACSSSDAARCLRIAQEVVRWVVSHDVAPTSLVSEWPTIRGAAQSVGNPNQMIPMAGVVGAVAGLLSMGLAARDETLEVRSFKPAEWTGGCPKTKTKPQRSQRGRRIESRLAESELPLFRVAGHDDLDAIGIGLYALGRLQPRRALAGAS